MAFKRERLRIAAAIIDGIPARRLNLGVVLRGKQSDNPHHCGTVGCVMGWLSMHPKFRALGLSTNGFHELLWHGELMDYESVAVELFGFDSCSEARNLFGPPGSSIYDKLAKSMTHKQRFRNRVVMFLDDKASNNPRTMSSTWWGLGCG